MMFDESLRCQHAWDIVCAEPECSSGRLKHGPHEEQCTLKHTIAKFAAAKEVKEAADGIHCRRCLNGCVDERQLDSLLCPEDVFSVSRHTVDFAARALLDRFSADTDAVLKQVLDFAALRYLREGSSTVTQEDVTDALRLLQIQASRL